MRARLVAVALAAIPLVASACLKGACEQTNVYGVEISVRDQNGDAAADSAQAVLTDGTFKDTMIVNGYDIGGKPLVLAGALDRAGNYSLCIHKSGFADYHQDNIFVPSTACGIAQQLFAVVLRPPTDTSTVC